MKTSAFGDYLMQLAKWLLTALLGVWMAIPDSIMTLTGFVIADFVTGLAAAFVQKRVDSSIGTRGGIKKCMIIGLVFIMYKAEAVLGLSVHVETWMAGYFIVMELVSIIENCSYVGIPIPGVIVDALVKVKKFMPQPMTINQVEGAFHPEFPDAPRACIEKHDCRYLTPGGRCTLPGYCQYKPEAQSGGIPLSPQGCRTPVTHEALTPADKDALPAPKP